jgi:hypothetical protein
MISNRRLTGVAGFLCVLCVLFVCAGCDDLYANRTLLLKAAFNGLTADGSSTATTTKLTLTFDRDIAGLSAGDITLTANGTGAAKEVLTSTGYGVYELAVSGVTAGGTVTVGVARSGYVITPTSRQVVLVAAQSGGAFIAISGGQMADEAFSIAS